MHVIGSILRRNIAALDHHIESSDLIYPARPETVKSPNFFGQSGGRTSRASTPNVMSEPPPGSEERARAICEAHGNRPQELLTHHDVQDAFGFVPEALSVDIADALNVSRAEVCGVTSFNYDFRREPPGRHMIEMCQAEAGQAVNNL